MTVHLKTKDILRQVLSAVLKTHVVKVTFLKESTGRTREMLCTLISTSIPKKVEELRGLPEDTVVKPRKVSEDTIAVFDLEKRGWRSFRLDSIEKFEIIR